MMPFTLERRALLKGLVLLGSAGLHQVARAQSSLRIGLVVTEGSLKESISLGAELGLTDAHALAELFGKRIELLTETVTTPEAAGATGLRLARQNQVVALLGGADDESAEALRDAAQQSGALFFNVGASSDRLRGARCHRQTLHVFPSVGMHVGTVGVWLLDERKLTRWALLTSDSRLGREVEDAAVAFLARRGGTVLARERVVPGTTDWGPVLQRFQSAGGDVVLVGVGKPDLLGVVRQYRMAGVRAQLAGVAPDPSGLLAADPGELAGVWPLAWHHELERFSARDLNGRFRKRFRRPLDGPAWAAWAAVKLLGEALVRGGATDASGVLRFIASAPAFDGHKGQPLTFREWDHQLRQPMYVAGPRRTAAGAGRAGALEVLADVPRGNLDLVAPPRSESRCRFDT
jgi:branched-chain amino acid transport system substrate-binding protein